MKKYSFYYVAKKYPTHMGYAEGKNKIEAFENLKKQKGYSDDIHLGRKFKAYTVKE